MMDHETDAPHSPEPGLELELELEPEPALEL